MAKLNAPLFSFEARGKIANSLVYFPWKGINAVRQYVIPTNPRSQAQQDQRGWVTEAVSKIHTAQAAATDPINAVDKSAYSLWAAAQGVVMTWFNTLVKMWVNARVAGDSVAIFSGGTITPASGQVTVQLGITASVGAEPTTGKIWYGTSKTALLSSIVCTVADLLTGKAVTGLTNGTKYYFQYRPTTAGYTTSLSGIYHGTPSA